MATINLGSIKFNWKGAYNSGTTYAVDDVVSSSGNSYVCIQAHSNQAVGDATAYWNIMSSAGTNGTNGSNGTDVGTVITTQGDILYRDGSGLQRLPKGTAGKALLMNSGANAPEWGDAGGGVLQIKRGTRTSDGSFNSAGGYADFGCSVAITPTASNSSFWINAVAYASPSNHDTPWKYNISDSQVGANTAIFTDASRSHTHLGGTSHFGVGAWGAVSNLGEYFLPQNTVGGMYTPSSNNANARTFRIIAWNSNNGNLKVNQTNNHNNTQSSGGVSTIEVWEIANGIYS